MGGMIAGAGLECKPLAPSPALRIDEPECGIGECFMGDKPPRTDGKVSLSSGRVGLSRGVATSGELPSWSGTFEALTGVWAGICVGMTEWPFFVDVSFVGEVETLGKALGVPDGSGRSLDAIWAVSDRSFAAGLEEL